METYNISLPIYSEVSTHFKKFVTDVTNLGCLRMYLVQFNGNHLRFIPSVVLSNTNSTSNASSPSDTNSEVKLHKVSINSNALIKEDSDLKRVKDFASRFNMLATVAMSSKLGGSTKFGLELMEMPKDYKKSRYELAVTLQTDDLVVMLSVSNLFIALSD